MFAKVFSGAVYGVDAYEVEIEVNAAGGNPVIVVVGLPDTAVKESKDRVTTAIGNSGYYWPRGRTTINLAPADVKKEGPSFDLPIALSMIACQQERELPFANEFCFVGELALTGAVRPVRGVLPVAIEARRRGRKKLVVPYGNAREAAMVRRHRSLRRAQPARDLRIPHRRKAAAADARGLEPVLRRAPARCRARFRRCARTACRPARGRGGRGRRT